MWVKFANLCRKSGRLGLAEKTLNSLLGDDMAAPVSLAPNLQTRASISAYPPRRQGMSGPPQVIYAHLKYMWATGAREETLTFLREFTNKLSGDLGLHPDGDHAASSELAQSGKLTEFTKLLARCYYKLGEWQSAMQDDWGSVSASLHLVSSCAKLTVFDCSIGRHSRHPPIVPPRYQPRPQLVQGVARLGPLQLGGRLALLQIAERAGHDSSGRLLGPPRTLGSRSALSLHRHTTPRKLTSPSPAAFFRSIALSPTNSLQDTLRLLTLWFKYGHAQEVTTAIMEGFRSVSVDTWLEVIPQVSSLASSPAPSSALTPSLTAHRSHPCSQRKRPQAHPTCPHRCRQGASSSSRLPAHRRLKVPERPAATGSALHHGQDARPQRFSGRAGVTRQSGAYPRRHPLARALARRSRGGFATVLRRPQH